MIAGHCERGFNGVGLAGGSRVVQAENTLGNCPTSGDWALFETVVISPFLASLFANSLNYRQ
ncbi:hypothetical protein SAMN05216605_101644 [Pseudomonas abietaniphila]|uniref:Uncharacterized protein n=1 Tax=Pseudomonas abietaniphila TaxID=89065 RepID=A0A1G7T306_9PSED|nr:hypothetical protein SAMN05216605_101644 [Pseudomonas abietaniphila]